jgi:hypothetical protein
MIIFISSEMNDKIKFHKFNSKFVKYIYREKTLYSLEIPTHLHFDLQCLKRNTKLLNCCNSTILTSFFPPKYPNLKFFFFFKKKN